MLYLLQTEQIFSKIDVANYTMKAAERMFVVDNRIVFWTNNQKYISDSKRVLFTSKLGTGKTTLLKAKTIELVKDRHFHDLKNKSKRIASSTGKIFFVVFISEDALLTQSLKSEMEELKDHVEVLSLAGELIYSNLI